MGVHGRVWRMSAGNRDGLERKEGGYGQKGMGKLATGKENVEGKGVWMRYQER